MCKKDAVYAVVQKIVNGRHGPYVVAKADSVQGSITFALKVGVWAEAYPPEEGEYVYLTNLRKKRAGWRSTFARSIQPSDKFQQPTDPTSKGVQQ